MCITSISNDNTQRECHNILANPPGYMDRSMPLYTTQSRQSNLTVRYSMGLLEA